MTTVYRERVAMRQGKRIAVRDYPGPEPALVLMHGFPDSMELYDPLVGRLVGKRRLVLFDFIGWGRSDRAAAHDYNFDNLTGDLAAVIDQLGLERPDLVAHDASGPPTIQWSLANPERTGHLVLLNTFYMMMLRLRPPEGVLLYMLPGLKHLTRVVNRLSRQRLNFALYHWQLRRFLRDPATKVEFIPYLYRHSWESWRAFEALVGRLLLQSIRYARPKNLARLRAYPGRVRIVFGAKDPYLNVHVARRLHELYSRSELYILEDAFHYVQVDEADLVAGLVLGLRDPAVQAEADVRLQHHSTAAKARRAAAGAGGRWSGLGPGKAARLPRVPYAKAEFTGRISELTGFACEGTSTVRGLRDHFDPFQPHRPGWFWPARPTITPS